MLYERVDSEERPKDITFVFLNKPCRLFGEWTLTLAIKKLAECFRMHPYNPSPVAATAHIDYETKMILFIVESGAGNTEANKVPSVLFI